MPRLRRSASLLVLPLVLQLALAANAVACVGQLGVSSGRATSAMPGMNMSGSETRNDAGTPAHPKQPPCNSPLDAGHCQPLAACASGALAAPQFVVPSARPTSHEVMTLMVLAPASRAVPPELPPPRA